MSKQQKKKQTLENFKANDSSYWDKHLINQFTSETDRGAIIVACSLFDIALETALRAYLIKIDTNTDEIFDDANSALATFSAKINMAYRLGIISKKFKTDLHIFRDIRNMCAHTIEDFKFESKEMTVKINTLKANSKFIDRHSEIRKHCYPEGNRGDFLILASWMISSLSDQHNHLTHVEERTNEWGYNEEFTENRK